MAAPVLAAAVMQEALLGDAAARRELIANATDSPELSDTPQWQEDVEDESHWHVDHHLNAVTVRFFFWLGFVVMSSTLMIAVCRYFPPPDRKWPKKRNVCGVLPWSCLGRMLGYGVIDWHQGVLTPFIPFFLERHDVLACVFGDFRMVPCTCRVAMLVTEATSAFALSMVLNDPEGAVKHDFLTYGLWIYVGMFSNTLIERIALRLSAIGLSARKAGPFFNMAACTTCIFKIGLAAIFANIVSSRKCSVGCHLEHYFLHWIVEQVFMYFVTLPIQLLICYGIGWWLYVHSKDHWTTSEFFAVNKAAIVFKQHVKNGIGEDGSGPGIMTMKKDEQWAYFVPDVELKEPPPAKEGKHQLDKGSLVEIEIEIADQPGDGEAPVSPSGKDMTADKSASTVKSPLGFMRPKTKKDKNKWHRTGSSPGLNNFN
mmetsp:Transcript_20722/g.70501  ORF Transcript_20722/g.70501 Transcript_20722/m.70501 type:complete len:427 (+) Transcript_20722:285-1565(+)